MNRGGTEDFARHLAELVHAELPLSEGLAALAAELPFGRLRCVMQQASLRLQRGQGLADVLSDLRLPREFVALVNVGVQSGRLGDVLTQYTVHARKSAELRRRFWGTLAYPLVLCVLAAAIVLAILVWGVPQFALIFQDFGMELPRLTVTVIALSDLIRSYGLPMFAGAAALAGLAAFIWRKAISPLTRAAFRAAVPIAGRVWHLIGLARFASVLAILVEHRIPLPQAIGLAGEGCGDELTRIAAAGLSEELATGKPVGAAARLLPDFPVAMLEACSKQQPSSLPDALRTLAEMYESRTEGDMKVLLILVEPLLFIGGGWVLLGVVTALFLPLFKLLNDLS